MTKANKRNDEQGEIWMCKKFIKMMVVFSGMLLLTTSLGYAANMRFENPTLRGTGCRAGTSSVTTSPDGQVLTIIFDDFIAEVPQYKGENDNNEASADNPVAQSKGMITLDHKVCNIAIPVVVPAGRVISALEVSSDFRGYTMTEEGAFAQFKSHLESWESGGGRNSANKDDSFFLKKWRGMTDENWTVSQRTVIPIKGHCIGHREDRVLLKLKNVIRAMDMSRTPGTRAHAMILLDSQDMSGLMTFKVKTAVCGREVGPPPIPRPLPPMRPVRPGLRFR
ncbi:MAG: hypothetical protein A2504_11385 [Bdellovibrionales bacterium RIFOXYD12_FULL_39_22]|nr:MAG: hypothetical protein A2385_09950 [Bdellovibrionales bacterium RIFOXYB1_FULL_39_21]OFZ44274.1 MAG: hypothetical protein A2485_07570 [Bdellovibrionales bacterium RIFOXYC12_FULL_39_17]OFZ46816.1 MAG: hypothetical protein A2404_04805 [Bdellovibrionales bacterium RIFOXYC1_FULL_39_130]OFZ71007.1 MAG: hypothetical protein A2451_00305 [Bdellovibrionales bacterium RIFOXYC2_FULL_39_8]OFZ75907.1 MAG: hypothetical protein A2560_02345 [Bdellovibrionales bacterium RIFOXYD1_FULL_39_84]OFZ95495.1 MAG: